MTTPDTSPLTPADLAPVRLVSMHWTDRLARWSPEMRERHRLEVERLISANWNPNGAGYVAFCILRDQADDPTT